MLLKLSDQNLWMNLDQLQQISYVGANPVTNTGMNDGYGIKFTCINDDCICAWFESYKERDDYMQRIVNAVGVVR